MTSSPEKQLSKRRVCHIILYPKMQFLSEVTFYFEIISCCLKKALNKTSSFQMSTLPTFYKQWFGTISPGKKEGLLLLPIRKSDFPCCSRWGIVVLQCGVFDHGDSICSVFISNLHHFWGVVVYFLKFP